MSDQTLEAAAIRVEAIAEAGFSVEAGSRRNSAGCEDKCSRLCLGYEILKFAFVNLIK